ncbi:MAG: hypothetical protein ABL901_20015 [Hyphomicrobiaceae bacterium]
MGTIYDSEKNENARMQMLDDIRRGDTVHVTHLHVLARRLKRSNHNMRLDLWEIMKQIDERGAVVAETSTGRTSADKSQRDDMIRDAIEVLTRGHKARSAKIARANGKLGGRPPKRGIERTRAEAEALWFDPNLSGDDLDRRLNAIGWNRARCYQKPPKGFGPRGGE